MLYKFVRDNVQTWACIVEADSLEEAKEKAEDEEWFEDEEVFCARYWGYKPYLDEGETCPTLEELDNDDRRIDEWDELEDDDFFNHWN